MYLIRKLVSMLFRVPEMHPIIIIVIQFKRRYLHSYLSYKCQFDDLNDNAIFIIDIDRITALHCVIFAFYSFNNN